MIIERLHSKTFPSDYLAIAEPSENNTLFSNPLWFNNFLQTIPAEGDRIIWIGCKTETGAPLTLWPLWQPQTAPKQPRQITSLANYYTTLWQPIYADIDEATLKEAIHKSVEAICQLPWDYLDLYPLNPKTDHYALIKSTFQAQKKHVQPYFQYGNWFLETASQTFTEYYAKRPSRLKNTLKRKGNKLRKNHTVDYKICTQSEEGFLALKEFNQLYKLGWKPQEPYPSFLPGLVKFTAEKGWLRFGLLLIDNQVAAAQIWISKNKTSYIYKLCHDPAFESYSTGSLLTAHLIEQAIDRDNVDKVDFLCGDDPYKKDWMSHREELWGLQISNPKTVSGLKRAVKNQLSDFYKKLKLNLSPKNKE